VWGVDAATGTCRALVVGGNKNTKNSRKAKTAANSQK
jgi:hypothetical protein